VGEIALLVVVAAALALFVGAAGAAPVVAAPVPPVACLSDVSGLNRCVSDEAIVTGPATVEQPGVPGPVGQPQ